MVSGRGAKAKGDNYERELAAYINKEIFRGEEIVTRTPLSGGGVHNGKADLEGLKYLSVEAKRTEKFSPHSAMRQAEAAANDKNIPVVITRKSRVKTGDSWVMLKLSDFLPMYHDYLIHETQRELLRQAIYDVSPLETPILKAVKGDDDTWLREWKTVDE
jgi:Holliday junction resolvase